MHTVGYLPGNVFSVHGGFPMASYMVKMGMLVCTCWHHYISGYLTVKPTLMCQFCSPQMHNIHNMYPLDQLIPNTYDSA